MKELSAEEKALGKANFKQAVLSRREFLGGSLAAGAVSAGGQVRMPMGDQFWGDRCGTVADPHGYSWTIATHKEDLTREEMQQRSEEFFKQFAQQSAHTAAAAHSFRMRASWARVRSPASQPGNRACWTQDTRRTPLPNQERPSVQRKSRIGNSYARACARNRGSGFTAVRRPTTASIG